MDAAAAMLWCGEDSFGAEGLILEVVSGSLRSEKRKLAALESIASSGKDPLPLDAVERLAVAVTGDTEVAV